MKTKMNSLLEAVIRGEPSNCAFPRHEFLRRISDVVGADRKQLSITDIVALREKDFRTGSRFFEAMRYLLYGIEPSLPALQKRVTEFFGYDSDSGISSLVDVCGLNPETYTWAYLDKGKGLSVRTIQNTKGRNGFTVKFHSEAENGHSINPLLQKLDFDANAEIAFLRYPSGKYSRGALYFRHIALVEGEPDVFDRMYLVR